MDKLANFLRARGWFLVMTGVLLIIAGMRLAITDRASEALPFSDDWYHLEWLRTFTTDQPDWGYPFRYHNEHYYASAPVISWIMWKLNGIWDVRLETLVYTIAYVAYAGLTMWYFLKCTGGRGKAVLCVLALVFMSLPVSGSRAAWGYVSGVTFSMLFGLPAVYLAINNNGRLWRVIVCLICIILSAAALAGCGSLIAIALAATLGLRSLRQREWKRMDVVLMAGFAVLAAVSILTKPEHPGGAVAITPAILLKAVTSSLAWPSVFAPPAAVVNFLPGVLLLAGWWRNPALRTPAVEGILALHAFLLLQAAGIAIFRGENNNLAMPANRYYDMLQITPFVAVAACLILLQAYPGRKAPQAAAWLLTLVLTGGMCIHFFYRIWPYVARENGEVVAGSQIDWARKVLANGWEEPAVEIDSEPNETGLAMAQQVPDLKGWVDRKGLDNILPGTLVTGHPLKAQSAGPFVEEGYMKHYLSRPGFRYWGSYGSGRSPGTGTFVSEPFTARGSYLVFDLILSKKARFSFYRMQGCELNVVDVETGEKRNALPGLIKSVPSLFRDREAVMVPVVAGRSYRVEAVDGANDNWFAFSEPADGGKLTPVLYGINSSGKLLAMLGVILAGIGVFAFAFTVKSSVSETDPVPAS